MTTTASLPPQSIDATLRDHLRRSWSDPCYFNDHVLRRSPYWRAQRQWALALVDHRIVAVETGNGLGKGFLIGGLVPWFLYPQRPACASPVQGAGRAAVQAQGRKERAGDEARPDVAARPQSRLRRCIVHDFPGGGNLWKLIAEPSPGTGFWPKQSGSSSKSSARPSTGPNVPWRTRGKSKKSNLPPAGRMC